MPAPRLWPSLLLAALLWPAAGAHAQEAPPEPAPAATAEDIEALVATLEDEAARQRLVEQLRLLLAAQQAVEVEPEEAAPTLGGRWLEALSDRAERMAGQAMTLGTAFAGLPRFVDWIGEQFDSPRARARTAAIALGAGLGLGAGALAWALARLALGRPIRALDRRGAASFAAKALLLLARTLLVLVPLAVAAIAAHAAVGLLDPPPLARLVTRTIVNAAVTVGLIQVVVHALLAPRAPGLRLVRMRDATARSLTRWVGWLGGTAVFGYGLIEAARPLGLAPGARRGLLSLLTLLLAGLLILLIRRHRATVARVIRGGEADSGAVRHRLAEIWHWLAIAYVVVATLLAVSAGDDGFAFMVRATVLSAAVLIAAGLLLRTAERGFRRLATPSGVLRRAGRYRPALERLVHVAIYIAAALALLAVWGADIGDWLDSGVGARVTGALLSIAVVVVGAIIAWEVASALIERTLARTDAAGLPLLPRGRAKTLLSLLRNALLVALITLVTLVVLSEIGVNIGPLLAGAGIVGVAIGFGSQALVKDVITGLFILFENSVGVGDVVEAGGKSGLVEGLSIRTLRLRDLGGNVHTIPWGEVTAVKNMARGFAFHVADVGVAYREDTDRVVEVIRAVGATLKADPVLGPDILEPIEILGVDAFTDSAVIIKARIKTKPLRQWDVGRAFNRLLKQRFDAEGIEMPFPHRTLYFGEDRQGQAPPARVELRRPGRQAAGPAEDGGPAP